MNYLRTLLKATTYGSAADAGLLILRMGAGLLMATHGWSKLMGFSEKSGDFYNFMGLGDEISLALTVFAEFFCSMFLVLGIGTRLILFLVPYITLMLTGPGKYSIDYLVQPRTAK